MPGITAQPFGGFNPGGIPRQHLTIPVYLWVINSHLNLINHLNPINLINRFQHTLTPQAYFSTVKERFRAAGNPETAQGQAAYMRHQFEYFGLKMPQWMQLTKQLHREFGIPEGAALEALVDLCFEADQRELQYFALETVQAGLKKQPAPFIHYLESLICRKSWWDTVDWINKLVGIHFKRYPELIRPVTERWMASGHIWLQRICLIFQLSYKEKTDADLLFHYVLQVADSKEFFLQKGAGWTLRQYAKTNPEAVRVFVAAHRLPALTKREALKHL